MFCVVEGDPFDDIKLVFYGPFEEEEEAFDFAQTLRHISWIKELHEPQS